MAANKTGLYIVDPDRKGAAPSELKDAKDNESQDAYFTRKYMEIPAAGINARVQSEIDEITRPMIDAEEQLFAAPNANTEVTLLQEELAMLQTKRKAKRGSLVFLPIKKT